MYYDWPVKKAVVNLPIRLKGNSKHISGNSSSPLGTQNKDFSAASQTLLTAKSTSPGLSDMTFIACC